MSSQMGVAECLTQLPAVASVPQFLVFPDVKICLKEKVFFGLSWFPHQSLAGRLIANVLANKLPGVVFAWTFSSST